MINVDLESQNLDLRLVNIILRTKSVYSNEAGVHQNPPNIAVFRGPCAQKLFISSLNISKMMCGKQRLTKAECNMARAGYYDDFNTNMGNDVMRWLIGLWWCV